MKKTGFKVEKKIKYPSNTMTSMNSMGFFPQNNYVQTWKEVQKRHVKMG